MNEPVLPKPDEVDGICSCCGRHAEKLWNVMPGITGMCLRCGTKWRVTSTGTVLRLVWQKRNTTTYGMPGGGKDGQEA